MANEGPNISTYKVALKKGQQLVICNDRAYLHPSLTEVEVKVAEKLSKDMKLTSTGLNTGEKFYDWVPS